MVQQNFLTTHSSQSSIFEANKAVYVPLEPRQNEQRDEKKRSVEKTAGSVASVRAKFIERQNVSQLQQSLSQDEDHFKGRLDQIEHETALL